MPLRDAFVGDSRTALLVMFAAVGVLLLIATVNVANLLLVRAASRGREIAVRLSLGAGRVAADPSAADRERPAVASPARRAASRSRISVSKCYAPRTPAAFPRIDDVRLDTRVLMFTAAVSIAVGVLFGLVPALQSVRPEPDPSLRDGARGSTSGVARRRMHAALVVAEISLSLMLLIGAGLLLRSFFLLQHVEAGFQAPASQIVTMLVSPNRGRLTRQPDRAFDAAATASATTSVAGTRAPDAGRRGGSHVGSADAARQTWSDSFVIEGQSEAEAQSNPSVVIPTVSTDYFRTLGIPLLRGRVFSERDTAESTPVTVISEEMARRYFANVDPIGRRIKISGPGLPNNPRYEVIGVVGNVKYTGLQDGGRARLLSDARAGHEHAHQHHRALGGGAEASRRRCAVKSRRTIRWPWSIR